eukprot:TRINITY_DN42_c1_g1_i1.p2 TRINITY_DN42_c1_g1~~TRINITY_DN42_c1_g1_i1.p2  ORF type:complete len:173 (+),score=68.85 TRINITY_DN42_c1_g1_i1:53-571(+)
MAEIAIPDLNPTADDVTVVGLDLPVPDVNLTESDVKKQPPGRGGRPSIVKLARDNTKEHMEFFKKYNIAKMLGDLTGVLIRDKPQDSISHVVQHLLSPKSIPHCEDPGKYMNEDSAQYLIDHQIHFLFDEFLLALIEENNNLEKNSPGKDLDVVGFALSWMRWNKRRFSAKP